MKNRCAGLVVVLFSLSAFPVVYAEIEFNGVLDYGATVTRIDSVTLIPPDMTVLTPDWGSHLPPDTFIFTGVTARPETLRLYGTMNGFPVRRTYSHLKPDTWYRLSEVVPETPFVMFYGDYGVEEPPPAAARPPRLAVSPSVVTGQMTVRLQPAATGRQVVQIHDAVGNMVRSLDCTAGADGAATTTWSREDDDGRLVPEGIYFCRHAGADAIAVRKILVAR